MENKESENSGSVSSKSWAEIVSKWSTIFLAVGGFGWTLWSTVQTNRVQAETRLFEAKKPYLEYQLKLYKEAVQVTQTIATTENTAVRQKNEKRFWQLYWGELGLVENGGLNANPKNAKSSQPAGTSGADACDPNSSAGGVETAMVCFGNCLNDAACSAPEVKHDELDNELGRRSLKLAHACRDSLANSWGVPDWAAPVYDSPKKN